MEWPKGRDDVVVEPPQLRIGPLGRLELSGDAADADDDRFEAICSELGILLARRVELVSARVLPFGREQLAMVELREGTAAGPTILTATAHGTSRRAAVAEAAIDAMTGGSNVLAAALPAAVAEGKVRTAVVFSDGESPVRWGHADDEARLAALYAVVPQLGTFTATAGSATYRVLRLPGIGVSLVSEGASAAAWVEGWFAALIHATQHVVRPPASTDVVAVDRTPAPAQERVDEVLGLRSELEQQSRRILRAAEDQAREILDAAHRDAERSNELRRREGARLEALLAEAEDRLGEDDRGRARRAGVDRRGSTKASRRESEHEAPDGSDAETERTLLLARAKQEMERELRAAEQACADMLISARREVDALLRDAERTRSKRLKDARREAKELRRDAARTRRDADEWLHHERALRAPRPEDGRWLHESVVAEARRAADDVLHEARRTAEEIVRGATQFQQRLLLETRLPGGPATGAPPRAAGVEPSGSESGDARAAEVAMLAAAAASVSAMATMISKVAAAGSGERGDGDRTGTAPDGTPLSDVPGLFFGA